MLNKETNNSTEEGGGRMRYMVIRADADTDGLLHDLETIRKKARELEQFASDMQRKITISGEPAKEADSPIN